MIADLVSIVIPVYNIERFLPDCFESLINQTYKNIEIIFVNDGSTDNSQKLLEDFCATHSNTKLINQTNKGLAAARAAGIGIANGEFLYNFDPDDMIHPQIIETFVNVIKEENADFVSGCNKICKEQLSYNQVKWKPVSNFKKQIIDKDQLFRFISGEFIGTNWSIQVKLYRMSTLKSIPTFPQITPINFSRGEDLVFNSTVITYCNKAVVINHVFHLWRQRHTSLTHTKKFNINDLNVLKGLDPYLNSKHCSKEELKALLGNKAFQASMLLCVMKKSKYYVLEDVENTYRVFKENKKYCLSKKHHPILFMSTPLHVFYWIGFVWKTRRMNKH